VPPGCSLVVRATLGTPGDGGGVEVKAVAEVREAGGTMSGQKAASGRLMLRPVRTGPRGAR
jgi:hypothetical protein